MTSEPDAPAPATDPHRERATSFGGQAAAYAAYRPDYPDPAVRWALDAIEALDTPPHDVGVRVLDLAAGTGKLTEGLARLGYQVTAVDPDPEMLEQLRARHPVVPVLVGSAEQIPLSDGSVDAVLVGQAFHWFDPELAMPEIARVLRPGGVLAALWNYDDDRVEWVAGLMRLSNSRPADLPGRRRLALPEHSAFGEEQLAEFEQVRTRTVESLTAMCGTLSHVLALPPAERAERLDRIRAYLQSRPETRGGEFPCPVVTTVVRRVRGGHVGPGVS